MKKASLNKFAVWITDKVGTIGFFLCVFIWTVIWLVWNLIAPSNLIFDAAPTFGLWLFISNLIQLFLLPLILVGQNIQSHHAELRAEHDLRVNIKAEKEIQDLHNKTDKILELLRDMPV